MYHKYGPSSTALRAHAVEVKSSAKMGPFGAVQTAPPLKSVIIRGLPPGHAPPQRPHGPPIPGRHRLCVQTTRAYVFFPLSSRPLPQEPANGPNTCQNPAVKEKQSVQAYVCALAPLLGAHWWGLRKALSSESAAPFEEWLQTIEPSKK